MERLQGHHGRRVEVARILHPQDEDADVLVLGQLPDLLLEEVGCAEKEFPLHVNDGNLRVRALVAVADLGQVPVLVDGVLGQGRRARLLQEEGHGNPDAGVDGGVQPQEEAGRQGDHEDHEVRRGGPAGDPDLMTVDHDDADPDQVGGQGGHRDVVKDRRHEEDDEEHHDGAEHRREL